MATAVLALALLGGVVARPAEAQTRRQATAPANDFIGWCVASGGDPEVFMATDTTVMVSCTIAGGQILCNFLPEMDCVADAGGATVPGSGTAPPLTRPGGNHGGATGGTRQFTGGATLRAALASGHGKGAAGARLGHGAHGGKLPRHHHGRGGKK